MSDLEAAGKFEHDGVTYCFQRAPNVSSASGDGPLWGAWMVWREGPGSRFDGPHISDEEFASEASEEAFRREVVRCVEVGRRR